MRGGGDHPRSGGVRLRWNASLSLPSSFPYTKFSFQLFPFFLFFCVPSSPNPCKKVGSKWERSSSSPLKKGEESQWRDRRGEKKVSTLFGEKEEIISSFLNCISGSRSEYYSFLNFTVCWSRIYSDGDPVGHVEEDEEGRKHSLLIFLKLNCTGNCLFFVKKVLPLLFSPLFPPQPSCPSCSKVNTVCFCLIARKRFKSVFFSHLSI